jgi:hypothetical protein
LPLLSPFVQFMKFPKLHTSLSFLDVARNDHPDQDQAHKSCLMALAFSFLLAQTRPLNRAWSIIRRTDGMCSRGKFWGNTQISSPSESFTNNLGSRGPP